MALRNIAFLCFQDGSASTVAGPCEVLKYAAAHATDPPADSGLDISVITPEGAEVTSEGFIALRPSIALDAAPQSDLVFVTGLAYGREPRVESDPRLCTWLAKQYADGATIAAVCAGQVILAEGGLLDGRSAAIHWSLLEAFKSRWPAVNWSADRMVVADQGLFTSCGATSGIDLTLHLVHRFYGLDAMMDCARWFLADLPRLRHNVPTPLFSSPHTLDQTMRSIEGWLHAHFQGPVRFEALAAEFGMSWRTFQRRFRIAFGDPPKIYLQKLRIAAAQNLLEDDLLPIDRIAMRVGYEDPAFFRALFKRHLNMTPSEYRKAFRFNMIVPHIDAETDRRTAP